MSFLIWGNVFIPVFLCYRDKILSMEFMKKYIHIAKCIKPVLSSEASKVISEEYTRLRSLNTDNTHMARTQPITARSLETMIRLSTAHARARMSKTVAKEDALAAIELVQFAYFKRVLEKEKKRRRDRESESESDDEEMEVEEVATSGSPSGSQASRRSKRTKTIPEEQESEEMDASESVEMDLEEITVEKPSDRNLVITDQR